MPKIPSFFFSHARQDRETPGNYLRRFFDDLEIKLAQWVGINLEEKRIGTIDARVPQSTNWDEELSRSLERDNAFVAILTPLYINRENCGKELSAFLLRSPGLGIDANGALTGVQNVVPIRWLPENAYAANTGKDSLIPPILRLIEDTPADPGRDAERTQAIERYRKKGMERCVDSKHYLEILDLFVEGIRSFPDLPPGSAVSFGTAKNAFNYDWQGHFAAVGVPPAVISPPPPSTTVVTPRALASVVAFYITRRPYASDPSTVDYADQLISESNAAAAVDPVLSALLADVRAAGVAERLTVFHAASNPILPVDPESLLVRLASLSEQRVLTALVVDPAVWPASGDTRAAAAVEQIIRSERWIGPVILPTFAAPSVDVDQLAAGHSLSPRLVVLPEASESRIGVLRRTFVDARGRVLRMSTGQVPQAERVPVLKGVGAEHI
jgi:TIR domain